MLEDLLIAITVLLFVPSFIYIVKRDDLSAISFFTLFVYTIFTQIGYVHFPQLSASQGVYFGRSCFFSYWLFVTLSTVACVAGFAICHKWVPEVGLALQPMSGFKSGLVLLGVVGALLFLVANNFFTYAADMHYGLESADVSPGYARFLYAERLLSLIVVVLYAKAWTPGRRGLAIFLLVPSLLLYLAVESAAGSRAGILYLAIALGVYHLYPLKKTIRKQRAKLLALALLGLGVFYSLTALEYVRVRTSPITADAYLTYFVQPQTVLHSDGDFAEALIAKDYYWPTHLLFGAIADGVVDPIGVARSNLANSFVGLHVEYLTELITRATTGHSDRISGFAFELFVEGFLAAGWLGWIYNGIVWNAGLLLWRSATKTTDPQVSRVLIALASFILPNIMRSQSCAFVKMLWYMYLPIFLLALCAYGKWPSWRLTIGLRSIVRDLRRERGLIL